VATSPETEDLGDGEGTPVAEALVVPQVIQPQVWIFPPSESDENLTEGPVPPPGFRKDD